MSSRIRLHRAVIAGACLVPALCGCTAGSVSPGRPPVEPPTSTAALPVDCSTSVRSGLLPEWAREEFVDGGGSFKHVEGQRHAIVGVVFGYPLTSPARESRQNKILWIAHDTATGRLEIDARLEGAGPVVRREVGFGGGQSIIDLPQPGCWRMTLHWGAQVTDTVDLPYVEP